MLFCAIQRGEVAADEHIAVLHGGGGNPNIQSRATCGVMGGLNDAAGRDYRDRIDRRTDHIGDRAAHCLVGEPAVDRLGRRIPAGDQRPGGGRDDGVTDMVDERRPILQRRLGRLLRRPVPGDDLVGRLALPQRHHGLDLDRQHGAVEPHHLRDGGLGVIADDTHLGVAFQHLWNRFGRNELGEGMPDHLVERLRGHQTQSGGIDVHDVPTLVHTDRIGTEFHQPAVSFLGQPRTGVRNFDVPQGPLSSHAALLKSSAQRPNRSCTRRSPGTGRVPHVPSSYRLRVGDIRD